MPEIYIENHAEDPFESRARYFSVDFNQQVIARGNQMGDTHLRVAKLEARQEQLLQDIETSLKEAEKVYLETPILQDFDTEQSKQDRETALELSKTILQTNVYNPKHTATVIIAMNRQWDKEEVIQATFNSLINFGVTSKHTIIVDNLYNFVINEPQEGEQSALRRTAQIRVAKCLLDNNNVGANIKNDLRAEIKTKWFPELDEKYKDDPNIPSVDEVLVLALDRCKYEKLIDAKTAVINKRNEILRNPLAYMASNAKRLGRWTIERLDNQLFGKRTGIPRALQGVIYNLEAKIKELEKEIDSNSKRSRNAFLESIKPGENDINLQKNLLINLYAKAVRDPQSVDPREIQNKLEYIRDLNGQGRDNVQNLTEYQIPRLSEAHANEVPLTYPVPRSIKADESLIAKGILSMAIGQRGSVTVYDNSGDGFVEGHSVSIDNNSREYVPDFVIHLPKNNDKKREEMYLIGYDMQDGALTQVTQEELRFRLLAEGIELDNGKWQRISDIPVRVHDYEIESQLQGGKPVTFAGSNYKISPILDAENFTTGVQIANNTKTIDLPFRATYTYDSFKYITPGDSPRTIYLELNRNTEDESLHFVSRLNFYQSSKELEGLMLYLPMDDNFFLEKLEQNTLPTEIYTLDQDEKGYIRVNENTIRIGTKENPNRVYCEVLPGGVLRKLDVTIPEEAPAEGEQKGPEAPIPPEEPTNPKLNEKTQRTPDLPAVGLYFRGTQNNIEIVPKTGEIKSGMGEVQAGALGKWDKGAVFVVNNLVNGTQFYLSDRNRQLINLTDTADIQLALRLGGLKMEGDKLVLETERPLVISSVARVIQDVQQGEQKSLILNGEKITLYLRQGFETLTGTNAGNDEIQVVSMETPTTNQGVAKLNAELKIGTNVYAIDNYVVLVQKDPNKLTELVPCIPLTMRDDNPVLNGRQLYIDLSNPTNVQVLGQLRTQTTSTNKGEFVVSKNNQDEQRITISGFEKEGTFRIDAGGLLQFEKADSKTDDDNSSKPIQPSSDKKEETPIPPNTFEYNTNQIRADIRSKERSALREKGKDQTNNFIQMVEELTDIGELFYLSRIFEAENPEIEKAVENKIVALGKQAYQNNPTAFLHELEDVYIKAGKTQSHQRKAFYQIFANKPPTKDIFSDLKALNQKEQVLLLSFELPNIGEDSRIRLLKSIEKDLGTETLARAVDKAQKQSLEIIRDPRVTPYYDILDVFRERRWLMMIDNDKDLRKQWVDQVTARASEIKKDIESIQQRVGIEGRFTDLIIEMDALEIDEYQIKQVLKNCGLPPVEISKAFSNSIVQGQLKRRQRGYVDKSDEDIKEELDVALKANDFLKLGLILIRNGKGEENGYYHMELERYFRQISAQIGGKQITSMKDFLDCYEEDCFILSKLAPHLSIYKKNYSIFIDDMNKRISFNWLGSMTYWLDSETENLEVKRFQRYLKDISTLWSPYEFGERMRKMGFDPNEVEKLLNGNTSKEG